MILPRFLALYGMMFAGFGVMSPFLPSLLLAKGLPASAIGVVLASGTAIRLIAGPCGGRIADRTGRATLVLACYLAAASILTLGYSPAEGFILLLLVVVAGAVALAPVNPIADALALGSAEGQPGFRYGWVRGGGSAAFAVATLASGQLVAWYGLEVIIWLSAGFLGMAALLSFVVPNRVTGTRARVSKTADTGAIRMLLRIPQFRQLMIAAALIGGSHALHDSFQVIRWRAAGLTADQAGFLWSTSVVAEVVVFLFLGRPLLRRLGPGGGTMLAAIAGIIRWGAAAQTAWFPVMAMTEPLHGLTFGLLHLACMDMISRVVPVKLAATAQAFYGTIAMGATSAGVTLLSGPLYGHLGPAGFWVMAAMCGLALPVASRLRRDVA